MTCLYLGGRVLLDVGWGVDALRPPAAGKGEACAWVDASVLNAAACLFNCCEKALSSSAMCYKFIAQQLAFTCIYFFAHTLLGLVNTVLDVLMVSHEDIRHS